MNKDMVSKLNFIILLAKNINCFQNVETQDK